MMPPRISRRAALALPLVLAACGGRDVPTTFEPLGWDYLSRLKLNVGSIEIDDSWKPRPGTRDVGHLAPTPPVKALRQMAEDRLIAGGMTGEATFVIDEASIVEQRENYVGNFAVHIALSTPDGTRSGYAEARVTRTRTIDDDSPAVVRADLYDMVRQMMTDMNVELEYQIRQRMRDYLQTTAPSAPEPGPVEQQDLGSPGTSTPAPAPTLAPTLTPPPPAAAPAGRTAPSAVPFTSPAPTNLLR
ncbi:conserved protein of unknown function [Rhodovastum atsumiense]|uniref:Uncharacterized protein n=1 Tax=Rhodovastum atsumiense TaxID=504468 RepID=A0A5M6IZE9_9PROT|nr:hypothetical protein [Rhodovastum atsumiense]KAA5613207.1 hypothetical protein F1189_05795 [Rhodovastum atsumiense]CAH2600640.1 conserved protein of unknown function [Rhodovastum atsumiense]